MLFIIWLVVTAIAAVVLHEPGAKNTWAVLLVAAAIGLFAVGLIAISTPQECASGYFYDFRTRDYAMFLDGELVGFGHTYHEAEVTLDQLGFDLMNGQY